MQNNNNTTSSGTPYDDVYRTMITDCPSLIIPVINGQHAPNSFL